MAKTQLNHWTKRVESNQSLRTQITVPDRCRPFMADPQWVTTVCGLACILRLASPKNQVSLTIKECSARYNGAPPRARGGEGALAVTAKLRDNFSFSPLSTRPSRQKRTKRCDKKEEKWTNTHRKLRKKVVRTSTCDCRKLEKD